MGLDQYAFWMDEKIVPEQLTSESLKEVMRSLPENGFTVLDRFSTWRKNHKLEEFMANLYVQRGGCNIFNCVPIRVTQKDLRNLLQKIPFQEDFVRNAILHMKKGRIIIYESWW